jgi:hypothetical protein
MAGLVSQLPGDGPASFILSTVMVGEGRPSTSLSAKSGVLRILLSIIRSKDVDARDKPEHDQSGDNRW